MRETEILVEQQTPQGVLVCDHAGRVINKLSLKAISTFENHCLEGKLAFGDPFLDSGVGLVGGRAKAKIVQKEIVNNKLTILLGT